MQSVSISQQHHAGAYALVGVSEAVVVHALAEGVLSALYQCAGRVDACVCGFGYHLQLIRVCMAISCRVRDLAGTAWFSRW